MVKSKFVGLVAASVVLGGTFVPTAFAATSGSANGQFKTKITLDGKILNQPYGLTGKDGTVTTTYMPMYYIDQALAKAGYKATWNGATHSWNLTNSNLNPDFSNLQVGTGNTKIYVNGQLVKKVNTIVHKDPAAGKKAAATTYVPIYYVEALLQAAGIQNTWNGAQHVWAETSPLTVKAGATYGPSTGISSVSKNVVITGTNATVQNVSVNGNIYVNPGANGTVYLDNVKTTGSIVVLSGATSSIHLNNVTAPTLIIDSSSDVHIVAEGSTNITNTVVPAADMHSVILDQESGSLGSVTLGTTAQITLSGTQPFSNVTVQGSSNVTIGSGVTVTNFTVAKGVTGVQITNNGTITTLTNNSSSTGVTVGGTGTIGNQTPGQTSPGGGGGPSPSPVEPSPEDQTLQKLVTALQGVHAGLAEAGTLAQVQKVESTVQSLTFDDWDQIIYNGKDPTGTPSAPSNLVSAVQTLMGLTTYGDLESDTTTQASQVQQTVAKFQSISGISSSTEATEDLYNFFENFKSDLVANAASATSPYPSLTTVVSDALEQAVNDTESPDGSSKPFVGLLSNYGLQASDLSAIRDRFYAQIDSTDGAGAGESALTDLLGAAGYAEFEAQPTTIQAGTPVTYALQFSSTAPDGLGSNSLISDLLTGHVQWTSSNPSSVSITDTGTATAVGASGSTSILTATVHGYPVYMIKVTVK